MMTLAREILHELRQLNERLYKNMTAVDDLNAAVSASTAETELLLAALASTQTTLVAVQAQLAALIAAGNSDPAIEAAVATLAAETTKVAAVLAPPAAPAA